MQTEENEEAQIATETKTRIPLTWKRNALYSSGRSGLVAMGILKGYFLQQFLLETATLSTYWVGTILLIQQIYDAVSDPIVGALSDGTRSRIGRRRPWILSGVIPMMLLWIALWSTPQLFHENQTTKFIYYLVVLLAFNTLNTVVAVPYVALITDVANDYNERTKVVLLQSVFASICSATASLIYPKFITAFPEGKGYNYKLGYFVGSCAVSPLIAVSLLITGIFVVEPPLLAGVKQTVKEQVTTFLKNMLQLFLVYFVRVCALYMSVAIALESLMNNFYLYMKYCLYRESEVSNVIVTLLVANFFGFIFWGFFALRFGKKVALYCGSAIASCGSIAFFFITTDFWWLIFIFGFIREFGSSVGYLVAFAMIPDVAEIDLIKNNKAREGMLYAFFILSRKMAAAVVLAVSSYILGVVGYEKPDSTKENKEQNNTVLLTFRLLVSFVPALFILLAAVIGYFIKPPPSATKLTDETDVEVDVEVNIDVDVDVDADVNADGKVIIEDSNSSTLNTKPNRVEMSFITASTSNKLEEEQKQQQTIKHKETNHDL